MSTSITGGGLIRSALKAFAACCLVSSGAARAQTTVPPDAPPYYEGLVRIDYRLVQPRCRQAPCPPGGLFLSIADSSRQIAFIDDVAYSGALTRAFGEPLSKGRTIIEGAVWLAGEKCRKEPPDENSIMLTPMRPTTFACNAFIRVDRVIETP